MQNKKGCFFLRLRRGQVPFSSLKCSNGMQIAFYGVRPQIYLPPNKINGSRSSWLGGRYLPGNRFLHNDPVIVVVLFMFVQWQSRSISVLEIISDGSHAIKRGVFKLDCSDCNRKMFLKFIIILMFTSIAILFFSSYILPQPYILAY